MLNTNAIKRASELGTVERNQNGQHWVCSGNYVLSWWDQTDGRASGFHTRRHDQQADSQIDYFPGTYWANISQAIRFIKHQNEADRFRNQNAS